MAALENRGQEIDERTTVAMQRSFWEALSGSQLDEVVKRSISELHALSRQGQTEIRERLLPALREIKRRFNLGEKVTRCNGIEEYLASLGINANTVRSWEFRVRQKDLKELMPAEPQTTRRKEKPVHLSSAEQKKLVQQALISNELCAAIENGGNFMPLVKEYRKVAMPTEKLSDVMHQRDTIESANDVKALALFLAYKVKEHRDSVPRELLHYARRIIKQLDPMGAAVRVQ